MSGVSRRQFGAGLLAVPASLPFTPDAAWALHAVPDRMSEAVRIGIGNMTEVHGHYARLDANYEEPEYRVFGPWPWKMAYEELLDAHACLSVSIDGHDPSQRAVMAWANRLAPRFCDRIEAFWTPLDDLSEAFAGLQRRAYAARRRYAGARAAYAAQPNERLKGDAMTALGTWADVRREAFATWARTLNDREFLRRMIQTYYASEALDIPYLQSVGLNAPVDLDLDDIPHCPSPCAACESLLGIRQDIGAA